MGEMEAWRGVYLPEFVVVAVFKIDVNYAARERGNYFGFGGADKNYAG